MENNDRLDEFLQRKFAEDQPEQRLAFRGEHWLQAQALIDAAERRRRRGFWWWWLGAGLVLLMAGWWIFAEGLNTPQPTAENAVEMPVQEAASIPEILDSSALTMDKPGKSNDLQNPAAKTNLTPKTAQTLSAAPAPALASNPKKPGPTTRPKLKNNLANLNSGATTAVALEKPEGPVAKPVETPVTVSDAPTSPPLAAPGTAVQQISIADFRQLPLPFPLLSRPLPELAQLPLPAAPAEAPERLRNWRWQLGFAASGGSALGHLENERTGFGAGLSTRLDRRGKPYSLNADLLWRFRPGGLSDSSLASQEILGYSFGYILDQTQQRVAGTHWLELPLYFQYHLNVVNFNAGLNPALLFLVQGREEQTRQTSLAPAPEVLVNKRIRLENRYFTKLNVSAFAGVDWQPTRQLSIGFRLHYQPGRIRTGANATSPGRSPVWADVRVRCLFGK